MDIELMNGTVMKEQSPVAMCTGYKAKSLTMKKGDFEELRILARSNPDGFKAVMLQLEGRFK